MAAALIAGTLLWASSGWARTHLQLEGTLGEDRETRVVGDTYTTVNVNGGGDDNVIITEEGTVEDRTYTITTTTNYGTVQSMGAVTGMVTVELKDWNTDLEPKKEPLTIITSVSGCSTEEVLEKPGLSETDRVKLSLLCCSPGFTGSEYFNDCPTGIQVTDYGRGDKAAAGILFSISHGAQCIPAPQCEGAIVVTTCEGTNEKKTFEVTESGTAGTSCTVLYKEIDGNIDSDFQSADIDLDGFFGGILTQFEAFLTDLLTALGGVLDFIPPVLETSGNLTAERVLPDGARVVFKAASRDVDVFGNSVDLFGNVIGDPSPLVECKDQNGTVRHSGDVFAEGTWTITCRAWDHKYDILQDLYVLGNESIPKSFTITVTPDATPPVLRLLGGPPLPVEATGPSGAVVGYLPVAVDSVDGTVIPSCDHPPDSLFPLGETTVTCTATDSTGNQSSLQFTVRVVHTTAPAPAPALDARGIVLALLVLLGVAALGFRRRRVGPASRRLQR
jgi:hypothetical protein